MRARASLVTVATDLLVGARRHLGLKEAAGNRTPFGRWYGLDGQPWCAMFVSKVFYDAGLPLPASTSRGFAYTPAGAAWFQSQKRWASPDVTPEPGWVVFFDFPGGPNRISHVGIVESARGPRDITTIEGNTNPAGSRTGGMVARLNRRTGIVGYGIPHFAAARPLASAPVHEEDDMTPEQSRKLDAIYAALFDGAPEYGVPAIRTAVRDIDYSLAGADLDGKPSVRKLIDSGGTGDRLLRRNVAKIALKLGLKVSSAGVVSDA